MFVRTFLLKQRGVAITDGLTMVNSPNIINYIHVCKFTVNHSFSVISKYELFTYILPMVILKSGIIIDQNDGGPLKWANGLYPIQIHANYIILIGLLKFLWALCKFDGPKNPLYLY